MPRKGWRSIDNMNCWNFIHTAFWRMCSRMMEHDWACIMTLLILSSSFSSGWCEQFIHGQHLSIPWIHDSCWGLCVGIAWCPVFTVILGEVPVATICSWRSVKMINGDGQYMELVTRNSQSKHLFQCNLKHSLEAFIQSILSKYSRAMFTPSFHSLLSLLVSSHKSIPECLKPLPSDTAWSLLCNPH